MPKEKSSKLTQEFDTGRETRVLLEQIHSGVRAVSEQHGSIMEKLQEHDQGFEKIDGRLDKIELKLIAHDGRFANIDARFDRLEKVITGVVSDHETRIKRLEVKAVL